MSNFPIDLLASKLKHLLVFWLELELWLLDLPCSVSVFDDDDNTKLTALGFLKLDEYVKKLREAHKRLQEGQTIGQETPLSERFQTYANGVDDE